MKSPIKFELQPFLPDRESPTKSLTAFTDTLQDDLREEPCTRSLTLLESRKENQTSPKEISQILELDSKVISFGKFTSGKLLGSTLTVTNKSGKNQQVSISVTSEFPKAMSPEKMLE